MSECDRCQIIFSYDTRIDELKDRIAQLEGDNEILLGKVNKLKSLILLTDPVVSNVSVSNVALRQWQEFIKCYPDEG